MWIETKHVHFCLFISGQEKSQNITVYFYNNK